MSLKITLDTGALPPDSLLHAASGFDFKIISVTVRETMGTPFVSDLAKIPETGVFDESNWDECVFSGDEEPDPFEEILKVISNGGFPEKKDRENLSPGQRNQLRDAMIFEAHVRERRDIFLTLDKAAFLGPKNAPGFLRERLEARFKTKIMTPDEFVEFCRQKIENCAE